MAKARLYKFLYNRHRKIVALTTLSGITKISYGLKKLIVITQTPFLERKPKGQMISNRGILWIASKDCKN